MDKEILARAEDLFMRYGVKSVSMDDVSRELGISKKTLYQYVESKGDLIRRVIAHHIEAEKCDIEQICRESSDAVAEVLAITRRVLQMLRKMHPSLIFDLQKYYRDAWLIINNTQREHVYRIISENLRKGVAQGLYRKSLDVDIIAKIYAGKMEIVADEDIFPADRYNREKLHLEYIHYHMYGVLSRKGLEIFEKYINDTALS